MKKLFLGLLVATALVSCKESSERTNSYEGPQQGEVMEPVIAASTATPGLNLSDLTNLVKNSSTAEEIERKLNSSGSFNQLDMDGDGYTDFVKVTELPASGSKRGFSFSVDMPDGDNQEVATVMVDKNGNTANINAMGNPNVYGYGATHHTSHLLSDMLIMHYLFASHRPYYSPYHYGHYPRTYVHYANGGSDRHTTTKTVTTTTTRRVSPAASSLTSTNKTVVNERTKALANPTTSQKSFKVTSADKAKPNTSGFKTTSTSTPSVKTTNRSSSPSSGSFGTSSKTTTRSSSYGSSNRSSSSSSSYSSNRSSSRSSGSFGSSSRSTSRSSSFSSRRR